MKIWKCDKCGVEDKFKGDNYSINPNPYPKGWALIRVYSRAQIKGGKSRGYHFCKKCKEEVFRE